MIKEIRNLLKELIIRLFSSRLFALALIFTGLFSVLGVPSKKYQKIFGTPRNKGEYIR